MARYQKQLGQGRPADTNFHGTFVPAASNVNYEVETIIVCSVTSVNAEYSICHDDDGSTFDEGTAIAWEVDLSPGETDIIEFKMYVGNNGNVGIKSSVASGLTFTGYGRELS